MDWRYYKKTEQRLSLLGLGCMRFPLVAGTNEIDEEKAQEIVDYAYINGVKYFDTAYNYHHGKSEEFTGRALKKFPRGDYLVADKMPTWLIEEEGGVEAIFKNQLKRLDLEYIDYYLVHSLNDEHYELFKKYNVYKFLKQMQHAGKIGKIGFSFHGGNELLARVISEQAWDFAQLQINFMDWNDPEADAKTKYEMLEQAGIPCLVMEPVRGGALATLAPEAEALLKSAAPGESVASWAIRFAAQLPNVLCVLSGMSSLEQIADNINTVSPLKPLSEGEQETLFEALRLHREKLTLPCTGCRYCMDCPSGVDIPAVFGAYNKYMLAKRPWMLSSLRKTMTEGGYFDGCTKCGACSPRCPQGIDIPEKLAEIFELCRA